MRKNNPEHSFLQFQRLLFPYIKIISHCGAYLTEFHWKIQALLKIMCIIKSPKPLSLAENDHSISLGRITVVFQECIIVSILWSFCKPSVSIWYSLSYSTPSFSHLLSRKELFFIRHLGHSLTVIYIQFSSVRTHNTITNVTFWLTIF